MKIWDFGISANEIFESICLNCLSKKPNPTKWGWLSAGQIQNKVWTCACLTETESWKWLHSMIGN